MEQAIPKSKSYASGFTLIELALVLVIIGLLVGGILVGQVLSHAATLRALVSDKEKYVAAVLSFRNKYNGLPGDIRTATNFWGVFSTDQNICATNDSPDERTCNGNGDDMITYDASSLPVETFRAWQHLGNAKLVAGSYVGAAQTIAAGPVYRPSVNAPKARLGADSVWALWFLPGRPTTSWAPEKPSHYLALGKITGTTVGWEGRWYNPVLKGDDALSIDQKIDDGLPYSGSVNDMRGSTYSPDCTSTNDPVTARYVTSSADPTCLMIFHAF